MLQRLTERESSLERSRSLGHDPASDLWRKADGSLVFKGLTE
jgi:hypothetical protein